MDRYIETLKNQIERVKNSTLARLEEAKLQKLNIESDKMLSEEHKEILLHSIDNTIEICRDTLFQIDSRLVQ